MDSVVSSTAPKSISILLLGGELVNMIGETRWALLLLVLLTAADFKFGLGESNKRYHVAAKAGDAVLMDKYKWRTSRAIRRTANKITDYLMLMVVGMCVGMALLEPIGVDYIYGAYAVACVATFCEIKSIAGHFLYLHGVSVEDSTISSLLKRFAVALLRRKSRDVGDALDEAFKNDKDNGKEING